jgi:hypothetical protein
MQRRTAGILSLTLVAVLLVSVSIGLAYSTVRQPAPSPTCCNGGCCFSESPPGLIAETFFPDELLSDSLYPHSMLSISSGCSELFWGVFTAGGGTPNTILHSNFEDGSFSAPVEMDFAEDYSSGGCALSLVNSRLYFSTRRPMPGETDTVSAIWYVDKSGSAWSEPQLVEGAYDSSLVYGQVSLARSGNMYFAGRYKNETAAKIFLSKFIDGDYTLPTVVPGVIGDYLDMYADRYIDPDERFLIFGAPFAPGGHDLYISYRLPDSTWGVPILLPAAINSNNMERFPGMSRDGMYFFFAKAIGNEYPGDDCKFYWINSEALDLQVERDQFVRVSNCPQVEEAGWSFGASWVDYDSDCYPDIFISNEVFGSSAELNYLYHNDGDGTYTKVTSGDAVSEGGSVASTWSDFDNDGDVDTYVSCPFTSDYLYVNAGDGTFTKQTLGDLGIGNSFAMEAEWVDYDNDGLLDIFVANHASQSHPAVVTLYHNLGVTFSAVDLPSVGLAEDEGNGAAWCDYDNDGDRDLFWSRNDKPALFFDNNGDGSFTQNAGILLSQEPNKYHATWADFDNDGDLDVYTNAESPGAPYLCENTGDGDFIHVTGQEIASDSGYWIGGYWGDYDNDGYLDLFIAANQYYDPHVNRLYHNNGDGTLSRVTYGVVVTDNDPTSAAAWADHDLDGDLDLFVANVNDVDNRLYVNTGNENSWIHIHPVGTRSNRSGVGAKIRLRAMLDTMPVWQLREVSSKNGFKSQGPLTAHFGLGHASSVDSLIIEWPSGTVDAYTDLAVREYHTIRESVCGDANNSGLVDIDDVVYVIAYIFTGGGPPVPLAAGDVDCNGLVDIDDVVYLITYIFAGGIEPCDGCR